MSKPHIFYEFLRLVDPRQFPADQVLTSLNYLYDLFLPSVDPRPPPRHRALLAHSAFMMSFIKNIKILRDSLFGNLSAGPSSPGHSSSSSLPRPLRSRSEMRSSSSFAHFIPSLSLSFNAVRFSPLQRSCSVLVLKWPPMIFQISPLIYY